MVMVTAFNVSMLSMLSISAITFLVAECVKL